MADSTVKPQTLRDTDQFLVQRPSVSGNGLSSSPNYRVSAEDIGIFASNYIYTDFLEVKEEFKDIQNQLDMINNELLTTIKMITTDHDIRIMVLEDRTEKLILDLDKTNENIEDIIAKTRVYFYHRLMQFERPTLPGEMTVRGEDDTEVENLADVTTIYYYLTGTQDISNIFPNEILELTSQSGITGDGATISHRSIFNIDFVTTEVVFDDPGGSIVKFDVTNRKSAGADLPYYQRGLLNEVRSDVYPVFTISEAEYVEGLDTKYEKTGGVLTGNVTIEKTGTSNLNLNGDSGAMINFANNYLSFKNNTTEYLKLQGSRVYASAPLNCKGAQIYEVGEPSTASSAATKNYVDQAVSLNEITESDLFQPGDPVAASIPAAAQSKGFFYSSGSLYFKV